MCKIELGAVIPVYNHPQVLPQLVAYLRAQSLAVILVDDGSNPACAELIDGLQAQYATGVSVVRHPSNRGKGAAVSSGLLAAQRLGWSHVLQLDADGQHHWDDVARFGKLAQQHPQHMIIGTPVYDHTVSKLRFYGRYATHIWVWINTLSYDIRDSMCGFRVYPVAATCEQIQKHSMEARMGFDTEILVYLHWNNVPFINVPTAVTYPANGTSHFLAWDDNVGLSRMHAKLFLGMLSRLPQLLQRRWGQ